MEAKRVVVTGLGILCPVGNSPDEAWQNAASGVSGAETIPDFVEQNLKVQFGGSVLRTVPLSAFEWALIVIGTSPVILIGEARRYLARRRLRSRTA